MARRTRTAKQSKKLLQEFLVNQLQGNLINPCDIFVISPAWDEARRSSKFLELHPDDGLNHEVTPVGDVSILRGGLREFYMAGGLPHYVDSHTLKEARRLIRYGDWQSKKPWQVPAEGLEHFLCTIEDKFKTGEAMPLTDVYIAITDEDPYHLTPGKLPGLSCVLFRDPDTENWSFYPWGSTKTPKALKKFMPKSEFRKMLKGDDKEVGVLREAFGSQLGSFQMAQYEHQGNSEFRISEGPLAKFFAEVIQNPYKSLSFEVLVAIQALYGTR